MFDPQQRHFVDLHENGSFGEDPKSWLSEERHSSPLASSNAPANNGNFDRVLFKNLVEMVPLVESLMDRRANTSFTRRASLIYTRTPSRESFPKKGRKIAQTGPCKKPRDLGDNDPGKNNNRDNQDSCTDDFSMFSSRALAMEKDKEELILLQKQVEDLQMKLLEKDEKLKSMENSVNQMGSVNVKLEELKRQVSEKDSLIKSTNLQLSNAKVQLADKQAALEKLEWEAMTSDKKVEKLQADLGSIQGEIAVFMQVFEALGKSNSTSDAEEENALLRPLHQLPPAELIDGTEMQKMEDVRKAYVSAVAAAKENPGEESLAMAAAARLKLQAFVFGPNMYASHCSPSAATEMLA